MKIKLKLYATLMRFLPSNTSGHEVDLVVDDSTSIFDIIDRFGISRTEAFLVLVNGVYVHECDRSRPMKENDTLAIWPPVAGG